MNNNINTKDSLINLFNILLLHTSFLLLAFYSINNLVYFASVPIFILISIIHQKF